MLSAAAIRGRAPRTPPRPAVLLLAAVALVACTKPPAAQRTEPEVHPLAGWSSVTLPSTMDPATLTTSANTLLVGGRTSSGKVRPVIATIRGAGAGNSIPLRPRSPYAAVANIVSVATDGRRIVALGEARGGAHSNVRWTSWSGSAAGLTEFPQTFETFGGESAGSLLGVVFTGKGPIIVGSWAGRYGLDAAVWLPDGTRWLRRSSAGSSLANTKDTQVAPRSAVSAGNGVLLTGSVIQLSEGVKQSAAAWTWPNPDAQWRLIQLSEPGTRSEALSATCSTGNCWAAGYADGRLAAWRITGQVASQIGELPELTVTPDGPAPRVIRIGARPGIVLTNSGQAQLLLQQDRSWQLYAGPPGTMIAAEVVGSRLYAIVQRDGQRSQLWQCDLAAAGLT